MELAELAEAALNKQEKKKKQKKKSKKDANDEDDDFLEACIASNKQLISEQESQVKVKQFDFGAHILNLYLTRLRAIEKSTDLMPGKGESDFGNMYHFLYVVHGSEMAKRVLLD